MKDPRVEALLAEARNASSIEEALESTLKAISLAPAAPDPYALRALLAVAARRAGVAAHYFRVAYGRGHRSLETRMGLSICFQAVGDQAGGEAIARGHEVPRVLAPFAKLAASALFDIRRALEGALPSADTPAWHPTDVERIGFTDPAPARPVAVSSRPPAAAQTLPVVDEGGGEMPLGPLIDIQEAPRPDWLEVTESFGGGGMLGRPTWLEDTAQDNPRDVRAGGPVRALNCAMDPGLPTVGVVSPVTGRSVPTSVLEGTRRRADVGQFDAPRTLLEARERLLPWTTPMVTIHLALALPGPVVTEPGKRPRKLCEEMVLGLTDTELILLDVKKPGASPARIELVTLEGMKSAPNGFQVSLSLSEGKQVHLDLRTLQRDAARVGDAAIRRLADCLRPYVQEE